MEGFTEEPPVKKQKTDSMNTQVVVSATGLITMASTSAIGQDQHSAIAGMSLISTTSNILPTSVVAPKTYVATGLKTITMTPQGQVLGSSLRPGVSMTSVIRPSLQLQAIQAGQPKIIPGVQGSVQLRQGTGNPTTSVGPLRPLVQPTTSVGQLRPLVQPTTSVGQLRPLVQPTTSVSQLRPLVQPTTSVGQLRPLVQPTTSVGQLRPLLQPTTSVGQLRPLVQPTTSVGQLRPLIQPTTSVGQLRPIVQPTTSVGQLRPLVQPTTSVGQLRPLVQPTTSVGQLRPVVQPTTNVGQLRPVVQPTTNVGQLRPVVQFANPATRPSMQLNSSTLQQLSGNQKMTFQITHPTGVRAIPPRSAANIPPRSPLAVPQVVTISGVSAPRFTTIQTLHQNTIATSILSNTVNKGPTSSNLQLQSITSAKVKSDQTNPPEQVNLGAHKIRVQVPPSQSTTSGTGKSLLDTSSKPAMVATSADSRSLLSSGENSVIQKSLSSSQSTTDTTAAQSKIFSSVGSSISQYKLNKSGSFIVQSGKPVTYIPSTQAPSQVVTQIVKADSKTLSGKVTMAEAQIMLPSGPATISWPIPPKTSGSDGNKQYVMTGNQIIRSVPTTGKLIVGKQLVTSTATSPSRPNILGSSPMSRIKVPGGGSPIKFSSVAEVSKDSNPAISTKSSVLSVQKNWELVKQSGNLLPQKSDTRSADANSENTSNLQKVTDYVATSNKENTTNSLPQNSADSVSENTSQSSSQNVTDSALVKSTDFIKSEAESKDTDGIEKVTNQKVEIKNEGCEEAGTAVGDSNSALGAINSSEKVVTDTSSPISANTPVMCSSESLIKVENISVKVEENDRKCDVDADVMDTKCANSKDSAIDNTNKTENEKIGSESSNYETSETVVETIIVKEEIESSTIDSMKVEPTDDDGLDTASSVTSPEEPMETDNVQQVKESIEVLREEVKVEADREATEFDPVNAMEWSDGVGKLEGSNMKFRMNELGVLEMITDDLECTESLNTSNESEKSGRSERSEVEVTNIKPDPDAEPNKQETAVEEGPKSTNKDEISQCVNCGEYGFKTDFHDEGPFCSETCHNTYDSKKSRDIKKQPMMSKAEFNLKKGRKKSLTKDPLSLSEIKKELGISGGRKVSKAFVWTKYLEAENAKEAPARLFKNAFPSVKNGFRTGMKLEGIDPEHQSLFCVLSVAEVCGHRIRLHFDGYSECFDCWTDIDSPYIFPVGFCEKHGKTLQPPKGFTIEEFNWPLYMKITKGSSAPKALFSNQMSTPVTPNQFRVGGRLEAVDKKNSSLICVASISNTLGDHVLVHFDGWEDDYDYWCDTTSPFLHPASYCDIMGYVLSPPPDWTETSFTWDKYLNKLKAQAVPARAFKPRQAILFEPGMKVEVVDKRNPILVRVATILEVENYMVKIHFDGWSETYDYWLDDDSTELHPPGWCAKTGHPLVPPITPSDLIVTNGPGICPTPGCKGLGHIKGSKYTGHHSTFGCPYSEINMNKESVVGDRLGNLPRVEEPVPQAANSDTPPNAVETKPAATLANTQQNGELVKKLSRGRKPKSYHQNLDDICAKAAMENREDEHALRQGIHNSVFDISSMITAPRSDSPLCWEQHSKLLPGVTSIRGNDVTKWSTDEVVEFVEQLPGCEAQAKLFKDEQIDGEAFLLLTQSDIVKIMNIKLGPALKIFNSIIMFKNSISV